MCGGRGRGHRRLRSDRRPLQQRGDRRGRDGRGDLTRAVGAGDGRQRPRRVPRRQGGPAGHGRRRTRVDHQHVVDDRRDRPGATGLVRGVEGGGPGPHAPDAGRLRRPRDPGQRAAARDDPHPVRRPLPAESYDDPVAGLENSGSASSPGTSVGRRTSPPRRCSLPRTNRGSFWAPACSWTAACAARSERSMRLLSHAVKDGEDRLAVGRRRRPCRRRRAPARWGRRGRWGGS